MKKWFLVSVVLCLAACIDVGDFGSFWNKAYIDPALEGRWRKAADTDEDANKPAAHEWVFTVKGDAYSVQSYVHGRPDPDNPPTYPVKTLDVGPYHFLVTGPEKGVMVRYTINGTSASWYEIDVKNAWTFIKKNYPDAGNIYKEEPDNPEDWDNLDDTPWKISTFDDAVFQALAHLPDNEIYWNQDTDLEKVK